MPIHSKKLFVDSSVLIAFVDRADKNHQKAVKIMESLAKLEYQLYTSYQVISDTYAVLSREIGLYVALDFLQASIESEMEILFPQKIDLIAAHRMIRANRERQITLKETITATLMSKRGITQILTFNYWHNLFGTFTSNFA